VYLKSIKSKGFEYLKIVESYRDKSDGKIKHKVILNLGRLDNLIEHSALIKKLIEKLRQDKYFTKDDINKDGEAIELNYGYYVLKKIWNSYKLDKFFIEELKRIDSNIEDKSSFLKTLFSMIVHKALMTEASKLGYFNNREFFYDLNEDLKLHNLYRYLDILSQMKERIEEHLLKTSLNLFNRDLTVCFYDVTTIRFESKIEDKDINEIEDSSISVKEFLFSLYFTPYKPKEYKKDFLNYNSLQAKLSRYKIVNGLRRFGLSKDNKPNDTQIVLSLLLDNSGLPLGFDIYEGNKAELTTILDSLDKLKQRFHIEKITVVADRGLSKWINLYEIKQRGYEYIMAYNFKNQKDLEKEILTTQESYNQISFNAQDGYYGYKEFVYTDTKKGCKIYKGYTPFDNAKQNNFYDKQKNKDIKLYKDNKQREYIKQDITLTHKVIATYSDIRARKDERDRNRKIEKLQQKIKNNQSVVKKSKFVKENLSNNKDSNTTDNSCKKDYSIDWEKIKEDKIYDGYYAIIASDTSIDALEAIDRHKALYEIEDGFRDLKSYIKIRPIRHFKRERIIGHTIVSFLSYFFLKNIEFRLEKSEKFKQFKEKNSFTLSIKKIQEALLSLKIVRVKAKEKDIFIKLKHNTLASKIIDLFKLKSPKNSSTKEELDESLNIKQDKDPTLFDDI